MLNGTRGQSAKLYLVVPDDALITSSISIISIDARFTLSECYIFTGGFDDYWGL